MNKAKRYLSCIILVLFLMQLLPTGIISFAADISKQSTYEHLTQVPIGYTGIYTKSDLKKVNNNLEGKYILMNDIVFTQDDFTQNGVIRGWTPIGKDSDNAFKGVFDGNGYIIRNIIIKTPLDAGLFGCNIGTIKNLGIVGGTVNGDDSAFIGGIAGANENGTISNCYYSGIITSSSEYSFVGGISGYNCGTIKNCYNTGTVISSYYYTFTGGICGYNEHEISRCYNTGIVSASYDDYSGAIAGVNDDTIIGCYYVDTISKGVGEGTDTSVRLNPEQLKSANSFPAFDFNSTWQICSDSSFSVPTLRAVAHVEAEENTTEFAGGRGTFYNPYKITTKSQLLNVSKYYTSYFELLNDIEFADADFEQGGMFYNNGAGWLPITVFAGVFNGNSHVIKNIYIDLISSSGVSVGLFGQNRGIIKNLGVVDGKVKSSVTISKAPSSDIYNYTGAIAGNSFGTCASISNCYTNCNISASINAPSEFEKSSGACYIYAGGISGSLYNKNGCISSCYNIGNINASYNLFPKFSGSTHIYIGGITGSCAASGSTLSKCYNTGDIDALSSYSDTSVCGGGIAGTCADISNCYNTGTVFSGAGLNNNCVSAGGIAASCSIATNCYNIGTANGAAIAKGSASINNCYYLNFVGYGNDSSDKGTGITLENLSKKESYAGFDFSYVWQISEESEYKFPILKGLPHYEKHEDNTNFDGGNGKAYNPYKITSKEQLNNVRNHLHCSYTLLNDIEFTASDFEEGGAFYNDGQGWIPLGADDNSAFVGVFFGNNHEIKNIYINISSSSTVYVGLFGYVTGKVMNLGMVDGNVNAATTLPKTYAYAGGIAGYSDGASSAIKGCYNTCNITSSCYSGGIVANSQTTLSDCYNTGNVTASANAGGICAYAKEISKCHNSGKISSTSYYLSCSVGGIAGYAETIFDCHNTGSINALSADSHSGGIAGRASVITDCYNTADVSSPSCGGGIVGYNGDNITSGTLNIRNCYNTGNITAMSWAGGIIGTNSGKSMAITGCYNTGDITSTSYAGGIAGNNNSTISGCYNKGNIYSNCYSGGITGYNTTNISSSYNCGKISGSPYYAGGVAGYSTGPILTCYNTASVMSTCYTGGVVGYNTASISKCYNTGILTSDSYAGGIAGYNTAAISDCFNTGSLTAKSNAGGITGMNIGKTSSMSMCYNSGSVSAPYAGGISGKSTDTLNSCYYSDINSKGIGEGIDLGSKLTSEQMKQQESYAGFDFTFKWQMYPDYLPCLKEIPRTELNDISFSEPEVKMGLNGKYQTNVIFNPLNVTFVSLEYRSLDENIAVVDERGIITGRSAGETAVIVKDNLSGKSSFCTVLVGEPVTNIQLDKASIEILEGLSTTLTVTSVLPDTAVNKNVRWSSSDTNTAVVDKSGKVTAVSQGIVKITATAMDGSGVSASCNVNVTAKALKSISVIKTPTNLTYFEGESLDVSGGIILLEYDNGTTAILSITADMVSGFDNSVAGKQTLTVTYCDCTAEFEVKVNHIKVTLKPESGYGIDKTLGYITGLEADTTVDTLLSHLFEQTYVVKNKSGAILTGSDIVGTGCTVQIVNKKGEPLDSLTVMIKGDVDGDGVVTVTDARTVLRVSVDLETLSEVYCDAAKVIADGTQMPGVEDARKILRVAVKLEVL